MGDRANMIVKDLISILETFPNDKEVVVYSEYFGNELDISDVRPIHYQDEVGAVIIECE